jgi:hypothetical protein
MRGQNIKFRFEVVPIIAQLHCCMVPPRFRLKPDEPVRSDAVAENAVGAVELA